MGVVNWFDLLLFGGPLVWLFARFGMRWTASSEEFGYVLLKQKAAALGVDVDRIPDQAWDAIVDMSIATAKDRAMCSAAAQDRGARNWQSDLVGRLQEEAVAISKFMNGAPCKANAVAPHILTEYRV